MIAWAINVDEDICGVELQLSARLRGQINWIYQLFGIALATNMSLPELDQIGNANPDCFFELFEAIAPASVPEDWLHHWYLPSGKPWRSCAKRNHAYLLRFHELADFNISFGGDRITCHPAPNIPIETIRHLLLDQVMPLCLNLRGDEAIHASALVTPYGACGFLGESGSGKSTLAASLVSSGCTLLGDDCLALRKVAGEIVAIQTYGGLRLWPATAEVLFSEMGSLPAVSHYNQKRRVAIDASLPKSPPPLKALFVLRPSESNDRDELNVERLSPAESLTELLRHAFRLDVTDREMLARQFNFLGSMISQVPVYRLRFQHNFAALPIVNQLIFDSMAQTEASRGGSR